MVARWMACGVLGAGLLLSSGCKRDDERFPAPKPFVFEGFGGGGAGGGSGGTSAGGGGSGGAGGATLPNNCECSYSSVFDAPCGDCVIESSNAGCAAVKSACSNDPGCATLLACPSMCKLQPAPDQTACVQDCYLMAPHDASLDFYNAYLACICSACGAECGTATPIACP